ncbi:UDP-N-acetylhexosamine pyrophosphorylase-like isoform X3 [Mizuhopecten yessoensis]|uniref:UDP-N-acetylhexosamine pyrophosphorylase-like isoform X3 n=1 Tax=Mizuhopecten yessoensis TaxID=6573 RepID=UPI000B45E554|nr:UDP-N-acetylhexosamine pyrophosphorylase-like isoform X3 [Mizuhopecten yessoensis]
MDLDSLKSELECHGQSQLLQYWETLDNDSKEKLYKELKHLEYSNINEYFKQAMADLEHASDKIDNLLEPLPAEVCGSMTRSSPEELKEYNRLGLEEVGNNRVAVLLLAGGQGTRLGVPYPKGRYNVGLPSQKTLYQLQAERLLKLERLATQQTGKPCTIPWYIMTSEHTKQATDDYFQQNNYFGLQKENIVLFEQGLLPCIGFNGKIILANTHKVALAPDGNGGLYRALRKWKVLEDMEKRGVTNIHVYCVDNILVKMADPVFIGFCRTKKAECGAKVVEKTVATEAVGVVCKVEGRYQVVEYSEITLKTAELRRDNGQLTFNAGNICNHFYTLDFLKHVSQVEQENQLKHHVAKKKIPFVGDNQEIVKPTEPNGIKMEKFVFDVFHFADDRSFAVWEVLREDDFAPLKNADTAAKDTPTTCREALLNLHHRYMLGAGAKFVHGDGSSLPDIPCRKGENDDHFTKCEVSPLVSYAGEGLEELLSGKKLVPPVQIVMGPSDSAPTIIQNITANGTTK